MAKSIPHSKKTKAVFLETQGSPFLKTVAAFVKTHVFPCLLFEKSVSNFPLCLIGGLGIAPAKTCVLEVQRAVLHSVPRGSPRRGHGLPPDLSLT